MSQDPGDIPTARGQIDLVTALSVARDMPVEALEEAARRPSRISDPVLNVVRKAADGGKLSERERNLLFWGVHVLAQARDTRLLSPLLCLMRLPDEDLDLLLGDAITETFPRIVASLYDGDWPSLRDAILDRSINDIARWQLFLAAAWLTASGRIGQEDMRALLLEVDDARRLGSSDHGWYGWESAIALLGHPEFSGRVEEARRDGRLLEDLSSPEDFASVMAEAQARPDELERFTEHGLGPFGDAVDELEAMLSLREDEEREPEDPIRNPLRDVGRNDPCPCGSGKKFKKCCLAAA